MFSLQQEAKIQDLMHLAKQRILACALAARADQEHNFPVVLYLQTHIFFDQMIRFCEAS
jgi:hypothetical protein